MVLPPPMQSSLPAGWLAFTGREPNPLDHNKRFQITHPPFLDLSWRYRDEHPPLIRLPRQRRPTVFSGYEGQAPKLRHGLVEVDALPDDRLVVGVGRHAGR